MAVNAPAKAARAAKAPPAAHARVLEATPIAIAAVVMGITRGTYTAAAIALGALVVAAGLAYRDLDLTPTRQRIATLAAIALGASLAPLDSASAELGRFAEPVLRLAMAAIFGATARLVIREPEGQYRPTFAFVTVAMVACGQPPHSLPYTVAVALFVPVAALALARRRATPLPLRGALRLRARAYVTLAACMAAGAALSVATLVKTHEIIQRRFERFVGSYSMDSTGLTNQLTLGSMEGMLQSDAVVLRVRGEPVDYLRGVIYDTYLHGEWLEGPGRTNTPLPALDAPPRAARTVITYEGAQERSHLPLGACNIHTIAPAQIDNYGLVRPEINRTFEALEFSASCRRGGEASISATRTPQATSALALTERPGLREPSERERMVPPALRDSLATVLSEWHIAADAGTPLTRVLAIEKYMNQNFHYSLASTHDRGDPVIHFLRENRSGHCEYFASGMTLLARSAGVPARVVGGFRVTEPLPFGDGMVVRDRDAHAWVEAYIDGAWRTFDPTPAVEGGRPQREVGASAYVREWVRSLLAEIAGWAKDRGGWRILATLVVAGALVWWGAQRLARFRVVRARRRIEPIAARFAELAEAIERYGEARDPAETLTDFAARLRERAEPWTEGAAELLERYGRFRYGGVGDEATLDRDVRAFAARASSVPRAPRT